MIDFAMTRLFSCLGVPGPNLLRHDYGVRAFVRLEQELMAVPVGRALTLDFAGIEVMDGSFANVSLVELALNLVAGRYGDRFLILDQASSDVVENLEGTIARRKARVALLIREDGQLLVKGSLEPNLLEAWQLAGSLVTISARDVADRLGLEISTASMRLRKLYDARLLARQEQISSAGRHHIYTLPA